MMNANIKRAAAAVTVASPQDMHARILDIAIERERQLIAGCDPEDIEAFLRVARIMKRNLSAF